MATRRVFEVTRSASRYTNRLTLILIAVPFAVIIGFWFPFMIDSNWVYSAVRKISLLCDISGLPTGVGGMVPLIVVAITILVIRSFRDKPSTLRLEEGGIRPSWASRKLFFPKGGACFHPWAPAYTDSVQGACVELWCGRRSFIVGASGVSMVDLIMDAPPKRAVDCEVSSSVFLKIVEGLFGALPDPAATTPHYDISLAASSAGVFRGFKDARFGVIAIGAFFLFLPTFIEPDIVMQWAWVTILGLLCSLGLFFKLQMNPKRLPHVLRITENGLQYRDPEGFLLADAPSSYIGATKLSYRHFKLLGFIGERRYSPVIRISFPGKTLSLSCPYGRESWSKTAKRCGPPKYDISAYNWDRLISALSSQLRVASGDV